MSASIGHNTQELTGYLSELERLHDELGGVKIAIDDIYTIAKSKGLNTKAMKAVLKERMMNPEQRAKKLADDEAIADMRHALGMLQGTPLGDSAERRGMRNG